MKKNLFLGVSLAGVVLAASTVVAQSNLGKVERANKVYGKEVMSADNQEVGNLNNLVVDLESGRILYAIIGVDKGRVAVPPQIFTKTPSENEDKVSVKVRKQRIANAPTLKGHDTPEGLSQAAFISQVYQHFGQPAWWQGGDKPANQGSFNNVHKASEAIGMTVQNVNNAKIGKVENIVVDLPAGRVVYVILDPDSGIGVGDQLYALPPDAFTMSSNHKHLVSNIDKEKLASAPHFERSNWAKLSDPSFASQVYQHYGKQAYFNQGNVAPTGR